MKILVKSDVYNICNRIKKFDSSYCIVFNCVNGRYEIYSSRLLQSVELISGKLLSYVCCLPYTELDERAIDYLYSTSVERIDDIIDMIDMENKKLERYNDDKAKTESLLVMEKQLRKLT